MYQVIYSATARKNLIRLDEKMRNRIIKKVQFFSGQQDISSYSKPLINFGVNRYRFRIGDYRVIFSKHNDGTIKILKIINILHRKDIYRDY